MSGIRKALKGEIKFKHYLLTASGRRIERRLLVNVAE